MTQDVEAVRTYLELTTPEQLRPAPFADPAVQVVRRDTIAIEHFRDLYRAVGWEWQWRDRLVWSDEQLAAHFASPRVQLWECIVENETAGYFELQQHDDGSVEIAYFGLLDAFMGRGIGKALLTKAAQEAWALHPTRVWLHTCTFDSPRALPNYVGRGFRITRTETFSRRLPDDLVAGDQQQQH